MNLLEASVTGGMLILIVLLLRRCFLNHLQKSVFVALWGVVVCRLLIPVSLRLSLYPSGAPAVQSSLSGAPVFSAAPVDSGTLETLPAPAAAQTDILSQILYIVWALGMLICAVLILRTHITGRKAFSLSLPARREWTGLDISLFLKKYPLKRRVEIRVLDTLQSPLTYGIWHPVILLPRTIDWGDQEKLRFVLEHEMAHIRRFDTLKKWILSAALCIHWFNPLVWIMYNLANRDIELACDEEVLRIIGKAHQSQYALTLLEMEEKRGSSLSTHAHFSKNSLVERVESVMKIKKRSFFSIALGVLLVASTAVAAFAIQPGMAQNPVDSQASDKVSQDTGTRKQMRALIELHNTATGDVTYASTDDYYVDDYVEFDFDSLAWPEEELAKAGILTRTDEKSDLFPTGTYYYQGKQVVLLYDDETDYEGKDEAIQLAGLLGTLQYKWNELEGKAALKTIRDFQNGTLTGVAELTEDEYNTIRDERFDEGHETIPIDDLSVVEPYVFEELGLVYKTEAKELFYQGNSVNYIEIVYPETNLLQMYGDIQNITGDDFFDIDFAYFYEGEFDEMKFFEETGVHYDNLESYEYTYTTDWIYSETSSLHAVIQYVN